MNTYFKNNDLAKTILINVHFSKTSLRHAVSGHFFDKKDISKFIELLKEAYEHLKTNGVVYVFGDPNVISYLVGNYLDYDKKLKFRYWIAINSNENCFHSFELCRNHIAAIMLVRSDSTAFEFDVEACRTMRFACPTCKKNSKDWGGKKHLLNKKGVAISDVWNDFIEVQQVIEDKDVDGLKLAVSDNSPAINFDGIIIPSEVKKRLLLLTKSLDDFIEINVNNFVLNNCSFDKKEVLTFECDDISNKIICGDSLTIMEELTHKYPSGIFDLIFADPPYNLNKNYKNYFDESEDIEYEKWCNKWLNLCYKLLKPNGNLLILNLPKWTLKNISFMLNNGALLKDCIVWDAMSTPMGKIMPAHYSLVHFIKKDFECEINENEAIYPSINYCLRPSCIKKRNESNSKKVHLSNIWSDVHRIKHKKDRDDHPCQLPDKLMDRIITLFSKKGDLVFDPFCGAGTTAIAALKNSRKYFTIDISQDYVSIASNKINELVLTGQIQKSTETKQKRKVSKKTMEIYTENILLKAKEKISDEEFISLLDADNNSGFNSHDVIETYGSVHELIKKCTFVLRK